MYNITLIKKITFNTLKLIQKNNPDIQFDARSHGSLIFFKLRWCIRALGGKQIRGGQSPICLVLADGRPVLGNDDQTIRTLDGPSGSLIATLPDRCLGAAGSSSAASAGRRPLACC